MKLYEKKIILIKCTILYEKVRVRNTESKTKECANFKFEVKSSVK